MFKREGGKVGILQLEKKAQGRRLTKNAGWVHVSPSLRLFLLPVHGVLMLNNPLGYLSLFGGLFFLPFSMFLTSFLSMGLGV